MPVFDPNIFDRAIFDTPPLAVGTGEAGGGKPGRAFAPEPLERKKKRVIEQLVERKEVKRKLTKELTEAIQQEKEAIQTLRITEKLGKAEEILLITEKQRLELIRILEREAELRRLIQFEDEAIILLLLAA